MATSLTGVGILWATLSLAAALICCTGFYLPYWIQGRLLGRVDAYFSSFRRCNYPRVSPQGVVEIVQECGRYSRFWDIPSPWWQASTVLVGTGSALSLLVAVTATAACCITYVLHTSSARVAGSLQLLAALLVIGGAAIYPVGWDNREVRESCGNASHIYRLAFRLAHCAAQPTPLDTSTTDNMSSISIPAHHYSTLGDMDDITAMITVHHAEAGDLIYSNKDGAQRINTSPTSSHNFQLHRTTSIEESEDSTSIGIATVECILLPSDVRCDCGPVERPRCLQFENGSVFD